MRGWQDDLQGDISAKIGLTRYGPKRRRLTRAEWHAEKAAAEAKVRIDEEYLATKRAVASAKRVVATAREMADLVEAERADRQVLPPRVHG